MGNWFVDLGNEALEEGFRYVAAELNKVLAETAPGARIKALPVRPHDSLRQAQEKFRRALPGLRTLMELPADDSKVEPWTLGYINDGNNDPEMVNVDESSYEGSQLPFVIEFLKSYRSSWNVEHWREFIVDPVNFHMAEWQKWFGKLPRTDESSDTVNETTRGNTLAGQKPTTKPLRVRPILWSSGMR